MESNISFCITTFVFVYVIFDFETKINVLYNKLKDKYRINRINKTNKTNKTNKINKTEKDSSNISKQNNINNKTIINCEEPDNITKYKMDTVLYQLIFDINHFKYTSPIKRSLSCDIINDNDSESSNDSWEYVS